MQAEYRRNYNRSYMILEDTKEKITYEEKMIEHNRIKSLLVLQVMNADGRRQLWYDITGRESLRHYLEYEQLGFEEMEKLLQYLIYAVEEAQDYLLDPGHLLLTTDGIFFDRNSRTPSFAYCPFEEQTFPEAMRELMNELLRSMNHEDAAFVSAMYEIYEKIQNDNFALEDLLAGLTSRRGIEPGRGSEQRRGNEPGRGTEAGTRELKSRSNSQIGADPAFDEDEDFIMPPKKKSIFSFGSGFSSSGEKSNVASAKSRRKSGGWLSSFGGKRTKKEEISAIMVTEEDYVSNESETVLLTDRTAGGVTSLKYMGNGRQRDIEFHGDSLAVGSAPENDGVIKSTAVSKRHARFTRSGNVIFIEDLNSTNGTFVNEEPLSYREKRVIKKGDKIRFADEDYVAI